MDWKNARYNAFGTVDCEINHPQYGWIPFTCNPNDKGAAFDTSALFDEMRDVAAPYVPPPPPSDEELAIQIRARRDSLLAGTDWTQLPDVPEATRSAWAEYRQALRDVPQQSGFPKSVTWPTPPE
jgi:hypothetical protein